MEKIELVHGKAEREQSDAEMIFTDPPFDMTGESLVKCLSGFSGNHLVLITTMRQLLDFSCRTEWKMSFDFVLDVVAPKKSNSVQQPNYTHATAVYMTRNGARSAFNRKRRQRSDVFEGNGYWPTIIRANREMAQDHGHTKNLGAITDIIGSFDVMQIADPFAGSGTTGLAAKELGMDCLMVEKDAANIALIKRRFEFIGCSINFKAHDK